MIPKKRKALHQRRSKRASFPSSIDDIEWDHLEREEEEQPLKHGKGLAGRANDEDCPFDEDEVDDSIDDYEEQGVHPISLERHLRRTTLGPTPRSSKRIAT